MERGPSGFARNGGGVDMDVRKLIELGGILALGLMVSAAVVSLQGVNESLPTQAGPGTIPEQREVAYVDDSAPPKPFRIQSPDQESSCPAGVQRVISDSWEGSADDFPQGRHANWRSFDAGASAPGRNDEIEWGAVTCEASVGETAAWSVGGGTSGRQLSCEGTDKQYPPDLGDDCRLVGDCTINTELQFVTFDTRPGRLTGLRVTMDYMADIPQGARFFVGIGDFSRDARGPDNTVTIHQLFEANTHFPGATGGSWVRGQELIFDQIKKENGDGYSELLLTFAYRDPNPTTSDSFGVILDNLHVDSLFDGQTAPCPSPPTPEPTVPTATNTRIVFTVPPTPTATPTPGPTRIRYKFVPLGLRAHGLDDVPTIPTVPSPTASLTPLPTPTLTPPPSDTPRPSDTPLPTVTPTWTPPLVPDVRIVDVIYTPLMRSRVQVVTVENKGTGPQDMTGWTIFGRQKVPTRPCNFPEGLTLEAGDEFTFYAGPLEDENAAENPDSAACGYDAYIFEQTLDQAQLFDRVRSVRDVYCWDVNGPYFCSP